MSLSDEIAEALGADGPLSRDVVRRWIQQATDLRTLARLYDLTSSEWDRIEPRLERDETCALIRTYLLRCVREDPPDAMSRFDAARQLEIWIDQLADTPGSDDVIRETAGAVMALYVDGDAGVRDTIETVFLEHVLEQARLRPFFHSWSEDDRLRDAWTRALAWGKAHPDFYRGLRARWQAASDDPEAGSFCNVDLGIYARFPLEPLLAAFGDRVVINYVGGTGDGRFEAHLSENDGNWPPRSPDETIRGLVSLVQSLPEAARAMWNDATSREFDIGFEGGVAAGDAMRPMEHHLETSTLRAVAELNGRIVITVYPGQRKWPADKS